MSIGDFFFPDRVFHIWMEMGVSYFRVPPLVVYTGVMLQLQFGPLDFCGIGLVLMINIIVSLA